MQTLKWVLVVLALLQGGWLVFDGSRALITGDYTTASSGPAARQLGPWARLVTAAGLNPRSSLIKWLHVILGLCWLAALLAFLILPEVGWWMMLACSAATLWYLPIGTIASVTIVFLLLSPQVRILRNLSPGTSKQLTPGS